MSKNEQNTGAETRNPRPVATEHQHAERNQRHDQPKRRLSVRPQKAFTASRTRGSV
jgi:hypothetical protein